MSLDFAPFVLHRTWHLVRQLGIHLNIVLINFLQTESIPCAFKVALCLLTFSTQIDRLLP